MKKIHYRILVTICLLFMLLTGVALASEPAQKMDGKDYYKAIYNEYKDKPLDVDVQGVLSAPIGSAVIDMKLEGFAKDAKVCKMTVDITLQVGNKDKTKIKTVSYLEQETKDLMIYHYMNEKWTKQKRENIQIFNATPNDVEDNLKVIKSVEVLKHTDEITELKIDFDFNMAKDIVKKTIDTDNVNFKNQKERDEALQTYDNIVPYLNKLHLIETVDNKNKTLTSIIDFTDILKDAVNAVISATPDITANDRKEIEELLKDSKAIFTINAKILNKAVIVKVPKEARRLAKEIKPAEIKNHEQTK